MNTFKVNISYYTETIAIIRMEDVPNKNALTVGMVAELEECIKRVQNNNLLKVIIFCGLTNVFCSGADSTTLNELATGKLVPTDILLPKLLLNIPIPVIAAMEGHAIGGGLALGLCADIILLAKESRYGCTFMNMGFTPGMGITQLLENVLSPAVAHELLYTGECKLGSEYLGNSAFNYILTKNQIFPKAIDIAMRIAEKTRTSLELLKRNLSLKKRRIFEETITSETMMHEICFKQPDINELIRLNYVE